MITLKRLTFNPTGPTYGVLLSQDIPLCVTLERPWLDNQHGISCIPPGTYQAIHHDTQTKPNCWEITGVPDRKDILIHAGNTVKDSLGCILTGLSFGCGGVCHSHDALNLLRSNLPQIFTLQVVNP